MRAASRGDVVSFAALGIIGLTVFVFGGSLGSMIEFFNDNSGAVMGAAAVVTAFATIALAALNWSSWRLYQIEKDRDRANELRIAESIQQYRNRSEAHVRQWRHQFDSEQGDPGNEENLKRLFDRQLQLSRRLIDQIDEELPDWRRETRRPETVKGLTDLRNRVGTVDTHLSLWEEGPPMGAERDQYAERFAGQFEHLTDTLEAVETSSREPPRALPWRS